jgi:CRISPR type IV-associated protein Csf1
MMSPSKIALHASGFNHISEYTLEEDANCVMCGTAMQKGELASSWKPTSSFTNWSQLRAPQSKHICPDCSGVWRSEFMQTWLNGAIYTAKGVYKVNSADTMAHALLNPPEAPFVWARGDQKIQHLVWRTPVTTDKNLLAIRLGEKIVMIRRLRVIDTFKSIREAEEIIKAMPKEKRLPKRANPGNEYGIFKYLDWGVDSVDHGLLSDGFIQYANSEEEHAQTFRNLKNQIETLNFGEIWALMILLKSKNPIQPEVVAKPQ